MIFKYHTQPGGQLYGVAGLGTGGGGGGTLMASSASGFGVVIDSSLSAAEISQQLTPGSSGRGPFDLSKYPGFCRKMRVGLGGARLAGGRAVRDAPQRLRPGVELCGRLRRRHPAGLPSPPAACIRPCASPPTPTPCRLPPPPLQPPNVPVLTVQRMWLSGRQRNYTDVSLVTQLSGGGLLRGPPVGWDGGE